MFVSIGKILGNYKSKLIFLSRIYTITSHEVNTIKVNVKNNLKSGIGVIRDNLNLVKFHML